MNELKPCPFCGGSAELRKLPDTEGHLYNIRCKIYCCEQTFWNKSKKSTIENWNKRELKKGE